MAQDLLMLAYLYTAVQLASLKKSPILPVQSATNVQHELYV